MIYLSLQKIFVSVDIECESENLTHYLNRPVTLLSALVFQGEGGGIVEIRERGVGDVKF